MQEIFQSNQLHGLHHPGIAHHLEGKTGVLAMLGELHQGTKAGRIEEVDPAEVDHQGQLRLVGVLKDEVGELFV